MEIGEGQHNGFSNEAGSNSEVQSCSHGFRMAHQGGKKKSHGKVNILTRIQTSTGAYPVLNRNTCFVQGIYRNKTILPSLIIIFLSSIFYLCYVMAEEGHGIGNKGKFFQRKLRPSYSPLPRDFIFDLKTHYPTLPYLSPQ